MKRTTRTGIKNSINLSLRTKLKSKEYLIRKGKNVYINDLRYRFDWIKNDCLWLFLKKYFSKYQSFIPKIDE